MGLTPQQQNAVNFRRRTLLVSAGAGSGKTSTLSERIISRLSDPADTEAEIDKFLIVTFTNNSAKDLSEKIEKVLSARAAEDLSDKKALRQLAKLKYANISTISSFCVGVVRQHFEALGLPAKLRVCDPVEADRLLNAALEGLMEEKYAEGGRVFSTAVELFSGARSDESFFAMLLSLYKKVYAFPDPEGFMQNALSRYREVVEKEEFFDTFYGEKIRACAAETAQKAARAMESVATEYECFPEFSAYADTARAEAEGYRALADFLEKSRTYESAKIAARGLEKQSLKRIKLPPELGNERDRIHKRRDNVHKKYDGKLKKVYFGADTAKLRLCAEDCEEIENELFSLIRALETRFSEEKKARGLIDFTDAEKLTYRLFVERYDEETDTVYPTETAKKYRDLFLEIYIDEYQDINRIQDLIFRSICRYDENGHECNRFMVGDIKQSIYRFRNARPELFSGYLGRFSPLDEGTEDDCEHKEYLSNNFRCAENVVKLTNRVFSSIMRAAYGKEDNLIYSRYEKHKVELPCEILLCSREKVAEEETDEKIEETENDSVYTEEMLLVASKIRSVVQNPAYVGSNGKMFSYGDVTVLLRSTSKTAERYARCLESFGIPVFTNLTESFFDQNEIKLCLCLLHAIDNPLRDIYLAGVMRSELFGFSDEELAVLRKLSPNICERDGHLWQSVGEMADKGSGALCEKCKKLRDTLLSYKKASVGIPSDRLILKLFRELKLYNAVSEQSFNRYTENAPLRRENLNLLYHCARRFETQSFRGLSAFLDYLAEREGDPNGLRSAALADEGGAVKIMSIHSSKGLEFPVCILADLGKGFNRADEKQKWILNDTAGVGIKLKDIPGMRSATSDGGTVSYSTPFRDAVAAEEGKCAIEEEKRILYVAMTRAKELLILTSKKPKDTTLSALSRGTFSANDAGCFCDWVLCALQKDEILAPLLSDFPDWNPTESPDGSVILSVASPKDMQYAAREKKAEADPLRTDAFYERMRGRLDRPYAFADRVDMLAKISVSELKNGKLKIGETKKEGKKEFAVPDFLCADTETENPAARGTAIHAFMEHADFARCENSVEEEAKRLLEKGFLTGEQYGMLSYPALHSFFESDLYAEMKASKKLYREIPFTLAVPLDTVYEMPQGSAREDETILIQGKIDCFFENKQGGFTVVDFKTDRVRDEKELSERYRRQLCFYSRAVKSMTETDRTALYLYSFYTGKRISVTETEE